MQHGVRTLIVASKHQPITVENLELAIYNLQVALDSTVKRVHVPLDMRILKSLRKMAVALAFEEAFLPTNYDVHIWNMTI